MCGFVAVLTRDTTFDNHVLDRMRDVLAHRGPDGARSWTTEVGNTRIGLAHRRLAIIDLSEAAAQPMFGADGRVALVYNGEIYNYLELRAELEGRGRTFRTQSDTEVIVEAYLEWGVDALLRLNGMFGLALLDMRSGKMLVARDRFGEKPVYYARLPRGGLAVASEIKALLAYPGVDVGICDEELTRHLRDESFEVGDNTFFRAAKRLDPAHAMLLKLNGEIERVWRYWTPDYENIRATDTAASASEHFRALLERSVRMRLRSDVPVGSSLSGGLDSSSIVALVNRLKASRGRQHTFSIRYPGDPTLCEGPHIDAMVRRTGAESHSLEPDEQALMADWRQMHWHLEAPSRSASIFNQFALMRLARAQGVTVLLDGQGADELLGGYQYYFGLRQLDLLHAGRSSELECETSALWWRLRRVSARFRDHVRRFDARPGFPLETLWDRRRSGAGVSDAPDRPGVPQSQAVSLFRRQLAMGLQYNHLPNLLHTADRSGMAFGREARFPFLDHDLVEWCIGLPDDLLTRDGWLKRVLREATKGLLPRAIRWRVDKVGFAAPQDRWLREGAREWAEDLLFAGPIRKHPHYDSAWIDARWRAHVSGAEDASGALWKWLSASEWMRMSAAGVWRGAADAIDVREPERLSS